MSFAKPVTNSVTTVGRSEDEREPAEKKPEPTHEWVARCSSDNCICNSARGGTRSSASRVVTMKGVKKHGIKYRKTFCPDCGYAICWSREPINNNRIDTVL